MCKSRSFTSRENVTLPSLRKILVVFVKLESREIAVVYAENNGFLYVLCRGRDQNRFRTALEVDFGEAGLRRVLARFVEDVVDAA